MTTNYIHFALQLTTLSPLHIDNGESLSSVGEFLTTASNVQFLDQADLAAKLKEANLMKDYVNKILAVQKRFDFFQVLSDYGIAFKVLQSIKLNQTGHITTHNNILHRCIKTNEQAYIPGSSIKGLLRTAILFDYLQQDVGFISSLESYIEEVEELDIKTLRKHWAAQEKKILPTAVFQAIRPSDSHAVEMEDLIIEQTSRQHIYGEESEGLDWLTECIRPDVEIPFELTLLPLFEQPVFDYLKQSKITPIFKILNEHSTCLIDQEIELLQSLTAVPQIRLTLIEQLTDLKQQIVQADNQFAITRLGKGKTLFFNTILPLLSPAIRKKVMDAHEQLEEGYLQSRVLTVVGKAMMGWVKIDHKRNLTNNILQGAMQIGTPLKAHFIDAKKVSIMIDGEVLDDVQLVNKFKQSFPFGAEIAVQVQQITKTGKINQVKLIN